MIIIIKGFLLLAKCHLINRLCAQDKLLIINTFKVENKAGHMSLALLIIITFKVEELDLCMLIPNDNQNICSDILHFQCNPKKA